MQKIEDTFSPFLRSLMKDLEQNPNIFYTEEYLEIIQGRQNSDSCISSDTDSEVLKMLIYALKNKDIRFTNEYFLIILEIMKLQKEGSRVDTYIYNLLIAFLSFDYKNEHFFEFQREKIFSAQLSKLIDDVFPLLIDIFVTKEDSHGLFEKLKIYNPSIINIILENKEIIRDIFSKTDNSTIDKFNMVEKNTFNIIVIVFLQKIKDLDGKYEIITSLMDGLRGYLLYSMEEIESEPEFLKDLACRISAGMADFAQQIKEAKRLI